MQQKNKKKWADLSARQRTMVIVGALIQLVLLTLAQRDLSKRSAADIRGPKWAWRLASMINFVGPIAYFTCGRKRAPAA